MNEYYEQAVKKLKNGAKSGEFDRYAAAMKGLVGDTLKNLCANEEFAQAVAQGGSFEDCMKTVAKGVKGNALPDLDAIKLAVQYYFPGATVHYDIRLDLVGDAAEPETAQKAPKVISLADFF